MNRKEYLAARKTLMETVFWALLVSLAMVVASVVFEVSFVIYGAAQAVVLLGILVEIKRLINAQERENHFEEKPLGKEFDGDAISTDETLEEVLERVRLPHGELIANLADDNFSKLVTAFNWSYRTALQEVSDLLKELANLSYADTRVSEIEIRLRTIAQDFDGFGRDALDEVCNFLDRDFTKNPPSKSLRQVVTEALEKGAGVLRGMNEHFATNEGAQDKPEEDLSYAQALAENNHGFRDALKESHNKLTRTTELLREFATLKSDDPRVLEVKSELRDIQLAMGCPGWEFLVEMSKYLNTDLMNTIPSTFDPNSNLPELLKGTASMVQAQKILAEEPTPVDEPEAPLLSDELTPEVVAFGDTIKMFLEENRGATVTIWEDPMKLKYKARFGEHYFEADCMDDLMREVILTLGYYTLEGVLI